MGMIVGLMMTGFVVYGLYRFLVSRTARTRFFQELRELIRSPRGFLVILWQLTGPLCFLAFFWGLLIPPLGRFKIGELALVQAAGLGALMWWVTLFAYLLVADYRRTRRLRKLRTDDGKAASCTD
jgi:hypothetical protein